MENFKLYLNERIHNSDKKNGYVVLVSWLNFILENYDKVIELAYNISTKTKVDSKTVSAHYVIK